VRAKSASDRYVENSYLIFQYEYCYPLENCSFYKAFFRMVIYPQFQYRDSIAACWKKQD